MLDGEDCINVSGNTITGLKAGTATVTLRVDSQMNDKTYDLYTAPVTITVEGQLMELCAGQNLEMKTWYPPRRSLQTASPAWTMRMR